MSSEAAWVAVLSASGLCFALKLTGFGLPARVLRDPRVERAGALLPVALLSALMAIQTLTAGREIVLDARIAAVAVAAVAVSRGWPLLAVVGVAVIAAAGLRALTW